MMKEKQPMTIRPKVTIALLFCSLFLQGGLTTLQAQSVPEEVIESMVAEKPNSHDARIVAGFLHFDSGRFSKAEKHFAKAASLTPNDPYDQVWLYMAQMRQNSSAPDEKIRAFLKRSKSNEFIFTDIAVLLGDITPEQAVKQAKTSNDLGNVCEAHYYAAQRYLANGDKRRAEEHLTEAVKTKQESYWEYKSALAYLERMK